MSCFLSELPCLVNSLPKWNHFPRVGGSSPEHNYACRGQDFLSSPCPVATSDLLWFTPAASAQKFTPAFLSDKLPHRAELPRESPALWVEQISCCRFTFNAKTILPSGDFLCHSIRWWGDYFLNRRFRGTESVCFQSTECKTPLASYWTPCPYLLPVVSCKSRGKCWRVFRSSHTQCSRELVFQLCFWFSEPSLSLKQESPELASSTGDPGSAVENQLFCWPF